MSINRVKIYLSINMVEIYLSINGIETYLSINRVEICLSINGIETYLSTNRVETYISTNRVETYLSINRVETYISINRVETYLLINMIQSLVNKCISCLQKNFTTVWYLEIRYLFWYCRCEKRLCYCLQCWPTQKSVLVWWRQMHPPTRTASLFRWSIIPSRWLIRLSVCGRTWSSRVETSHIWSTVWSHRWNTLVHWQQFTNWLIGWVYMLVCL